TGRDIVAANAEEHIAGYGELSLEGDLLLTGTPEGVGAIQAGDRITAGLQLPDASEVLAELELNVVDRSGGYIFQS
ncbi:10676_t:CDS:2, partial [Acaulospora colombiana]